MWLKEKILTLQKCWDGNSSMYILRLRTHMWERPEIPAVHPPEFSKEPFEYPEILIQETGHPANTCQIPSRCGHSGKKYRWLCHSASRNIILRIVSLVSI